MPFNELPDDLKNAFPSLSFLTTHALVQPWSRSDPLNIIGNEIATTHGLEFFQPTPGTLKSTDPKIALKIIEGLFIRPFATSYTFCLLTSTEDRS